MARETIFVETGPGISKRSKKLIMQILNDPRGWRKYHNVMFVDTPQQPPQRHFKVDIQKSSDILQTCGFNGLSCAIPDEGTIYLSNYRWTRGSRKSGLNLNDYRHYLVNHEFGHLLGYDHLKARTDNGAKNIMCPVMVQQTVGIGTYKPNVWPTRQDKHAPRF